MHKIIAFVLLSFFSISVAKNSVNIRELVERIQKHSCSLEKEKAITDLKKHQLLQL